MAKFEGTNEDDKINGTDGDDTIVPLLGEDFVDGEAGYDTLVVDYSSLSDAFFPSSISRAEDGSWIGALNGGPQLESSVVSYREIEKISFNATAGQDHLDVDLGVMPFDKSLLKLNGAGGDDTLAVFSDSAADRLTLVASDGGNAKSNFATLAGWDRYEISLGLSRGNALVLGSGDDRISSFGGGDTIDGGKGDDFWTGYYEQRTDALNTKLNAAGTFFVDGADGRLASVRNVETILLGAGAGNDTVNAFGGNGSVSGGAGSDRLVFNPSAANDPMQFNMNVAGSEYLAGSGTGADSGETLNFFAYEQIVLRGSSGADRFDFTAGQYVLPRDYQIAFLGGNGDDSLSLALYDQASLAIRTDAAGAGRVAGLGGSSALAWTGVEALTVTFAAGDHVIDFNVASKSLAITGGSGADTIDFTAAATSVVFRLDRPTSQVADGISIVVASVENVVGSNGNDRLVGDDAANRLTGGHGADLLTGLGGADVFVFTSTQDSNATSRDQIADFNHAQGDRIDLAAVDAITATRQTNDAFTWIGSDAFHGVSGELREVGAGGGYYLYGDTNGDKVADLTIFVNTSTPLVAGDIVL